jgi:hypothetical protein
MRNATEEPSIFSNVGENTNRNNSDKVRKKQQVLPEKENTFSPGDDFSPSYGDVTLLNTKRTIIDSVSNKVMAHLATDILSLLGTSFAVYEKNGDYSFGMFRSSWCRMLDEASRKLCMTKDNATALASGKWLRHENCWKNSAWEAIQTKTPTDIQCVGGLRLYAEPIFAGEEIVGAVCTGYGNPPQNPETLAVLARRFGLPVAELRSKALAHKPKPPFLIECSKHRLRSIAYILGTLVRFRQSGDKLKQSQACLAQGQRLQSLGMLTSSVAHDFNNMLGVILGYADLALLDPPLNDSLNSHLIKIRNAALQSRELTRQLLSFARKQPSTPKVFDLNENVSKMISIFERTLGKAIKLA